MAKRAAKLLGQSYRIRVIVEIPVSYAGLRLQHFALTPV